MTRPQPQAIGQRWTPDSAVRALDQCYQWHQGCVLAVLVQESGLGIPLPDSTFSECGLKSALVGFVQQKLAKATHGGLLLLGRANC